jgi:DNA topoisomerase I
MVLSDAVEEVMGFYAAMLRTDYVTDPVKSELFNKNFFSDWRKEMTDAERKKIKSLE